jgi:hypothetical protein
MFAEDFRQRYEEESAAAHNLIERASARSNDIRKRLATVAVELRQAAATAGTGRESLLKIASKFEQNAMPGDHM